MNHSTTAATAEAVYPATDELAKFVHDLTWDNLPQEVRDRIPTLLVDYFRVGSVGRSAPWTERARGVLTALGGTPDSSILYDDARLDPVRAAYLNGVIAGSLDWDDTHVGSMLHPGVVTWPAVIAIGELVGASGKEMAAAAVAGYETVIRVGLSVQPTHFYRGFHSTTAVGLFGGAVAGAKLLGLGKDGIRDALALATGHAGGTAQFYLSGSEIKRIQAGKSAAQGVECALMARAGITGPHDAIEGGAGFGRSHSDGYDPAPIQDGLGSRYRILDLQMKPHAVSARVLATIETACTMVDEQSVKGADIASIEIGIPEVVVGRLTGNAPRQLQQSQMSIPFGAAMTFCMAPGRPRPLVFDFNDFGKALETPEVVDLSSRTTCVVDPEIQAATTLEYVPSRITATLKDGRKVENRTMLPLGCHKRPMTFDDVASRFRQVAGPILDKDALEVWLDQASRIENIGSAADLMTLRARRGA
ncbi:MAG: MmgE/PrpD family protein [Acetobacterales bacterium]